MRMVNRLSAVGGLMILATAMAGCGSGISFSHDMDPSAGFSRFSNYAWATVQAGQNRGIDQINERKIIAAIDAQLAAKGYTMATSGTPDFFVNFVFNTSEQTDYNTYYTGMGYGRGWYGGVGMGSSTTTAYTSTNGTLILDVFDGSSKNLIWRGTAKGTVQENASPEDRDTRITYATTGILKDFPAKRP